MLKKGLLILLPLLLVIGYVFSPYYSARQLIDAAHRDDVEKLQRYIDFPRLQGNIKARLRGGLEDSLGDSVPPEFGDLLRAGSDLILGPLVERFVSPEGIADIIQGRKNWRELERELQGRAGVAAPSHRKSPGGSTPGEAAPEESAAESPALAAGGENAQGQARAQRWRLAGWHFTGINQVVVDCREYSEDAGGDAVRLFLERRGLHWQLVDIALLEQTEKD